MRNRIITIILAVALILTAIPFFGIAEDDFTAAGLPSNLVAGETLYDLQGDLENTDVGSLPEGWVYGTGGVNTEHYLSFLWGNASGAGASSAVETYKGETALKFSTWGCEGVLLAPAIETQNYVFEATFTIDANNTYFGITSGSWGESYSDVTSTVWLGVRGNDDPYIRGKSSPTKNKADVKGFSTYRPTTGSNGEIVTLKLVSYGGVNYYYINGEYVVSDPQIYSDGSNTGGRLGLYSSGATGHVLSMTVKEIGLNSYPTALTEQGIAVGETLLYEDFEDDTEIPEGFRVANPKWTGWYGNSPEKAEFTTYTVNGKADKGIYVDPHQDDVILLPKLTTPNYVYEAEITSAGSTGSFGLLTDMSPNVLSSVNDAQGCSGDYGANRLYIYCGTNANATCYPKFGGAPAQVMIPKPAVLKNLPVAGTTLKLKVYSYNGVGYFYINDIFIGAFNNYKNFGPESAIGIGTCDATIFVSKVSVKALKETVGNAGGNYYAIGEEVYSTDFEGDENVVGALPDGWSAGYKGGSAENGTQTSYGWTGSGGSASFAVEEIATHGKVFRMKATMSDAFATMPSAKSLNYIYEINVMPNQGSQSFGTANNYYAPATSATGCMQTSVYVNQSSQELYRYKGSGGHGEVKWEKDYNPQKGEIVNLKVVALNGNNYVYYNGELACIAPFRTVANPIEDYPGVFISSCDVYVLDASITAITPVEVMLNGADPSIDENGVSINFYAGAVIDEAFGEDPEVECGFITYLSDKYVSSSITANTNGVTVINDEDFFSEEGFVDFNTAISVPREHVNSVYSVRPFVKINGTYYYGEGVGQVPSEFFSGDLNSDGAIDILDAVSIARIAEGLDQYDQRADVDISGTVDYSDVHKILVSIIKG